MENNKVKHKSSSIIKDALALFLITLISGLALSYVFEITKTPIEEQQIAKKTKAYQAVFTDAHTISLDDELMLLATDFDLVSLSSTYKGTTIDEVNKAFDSNGEMIGYIVKVTTTQSYKDEITVAIGYSKDGMVKGMEILSINETAGLGMNADKPVFKNQFSNKEVEMFKRTKTGAIKENEVNAISGATITTDAVVNAVNAGIGFVKEYAADLGGGANE